MKLTKKQALEYKKRWKQVELAQVRESQTVPIAIKFKQLCLLMNSFRLISNPEKDTEAVKIRQRWVTLKKKWKRERS